MLWKSARLVVFLVIGVFALSACGGVATTVAPIPTASPQPTEVPEVQLSTADSSLGTILIDGAGMSLYLLTGDADGQSICYDQCATAWPALTVSTEGEVATSVGLDASLVTTVARTDGTLQVAFNGHPLYHFVGDTVAGDVNGQGIENFGGLWWVLAPSGDPITNQESSTSSDASPGYDY